MTLTIGSLFSGIGGLELGLERAGLGPVVWQVEKDEYCRAVLAKHWPDATRYEDVKDVGRHNLAAVDVLCGGFPCQDISLAGAGAGLGGARSGLWSEYARIIDELRPAYVVVENVAALLGRGFGVVLGELAALGYDAWWDCIPAVAVGAPHRRDRLFVVAYANCQGQPQPQGAVAVERGWLVNRRESTNVADSQRPRLEERQVFGRALRQAERSKLIDGGSWGSEPNVGRVAHGVPARVDRLRALGNAVVPQVAEVVGQVIQELERQRCVA